MWIPEEVTKSVVFIYATEANELAARATGFLVQIPGESFGGHFYLVTARHNVVAMQGKNPFVRLNQKDGTTKDISLESIKWFYHPSEGSDIAVTPFGINIAQDDVRTIPPDLFQTGDTDLQIGYEVFITGLFSSFAGKKKNWPVVRVGNIAMLPEEKVSVKMGDKAEEMEAFLIEARSTSGISGSPVFTFGEANKAGVLTVGNRPLSLIGLAHGHWNLFDEQNTPSERNVNTGIAIVMPARKILETLEQEELKKERARVETELVRSRMPARD